MTEADAIAERYESFAGEFLAPLLNGGTVVVGAPLTAGMIDYFAVARPADETVDRTIYNAFHRAAANLIAIERVPYPDAGTMALAMAAHNLLAATDPKLDRVFGRSARTRMLAWSRSFLDRVGVARTRGEALSRHAFVSRFFALERDDVVVRNWAYTYRFFGRPVPDRVTAMPRLRMVKTESKRTALGEILAARGDEHDDVESRARARDLLSCSPLTELTRPELASGFEVASDFRFGEGSLAVLSDPSLRGAVAALLASEPYHAALSLVGPALLGLLADEAPLALLEPAVLLLLEIHAIAILSEKLEEGSVRSLSPGDMQTAVALVPALLRDPSTPGGTSDFLSGFSPDDGAALRRGARAMAEWLPADALATATALASSCSLRR